MKCRHSEVYGPPFKMEIDGRTRTARYVFEYVGKFELSELPIRIEYKSDNGDWLHYVENPNDN